MTGNLNHAVVPMPPPGAIVDKQTLAALDAHADLLNRARAEQDNLDDAKRKLAGARERDREQLAAALRGGKPDPGQGDYDKAMLAVDAAERTVEAMILAATDARDDLVEVVRERRDTILELAEEQDAEARERLRLAIQGAREAATLFAQAKAATTWAQRFPDPGSGEGVPRLPGLTAPNGEPRTLAEVLVALEDFASG